MSLVTCNCVQPTKFPFFFFIFYSVKIEVLPETFTCHGWSLSYPDTGMLVTLRKQQMGQQRRQIHIFSHKCEKKIDDIDQYWLTYGLYLFAIIKSDHRLPRVCVTSTFSGEISTEINNIDRVWKGRHTFWPCRTWCSRPGRSDDVTIPCSGLASVPSLPVHKPIRLGINSCHISSTRSHIHWATTLFGHSSPTLDRPLQAIILPLIDADRLVNYSWSHTYIYCEDHLAVINFARTGQLFFTQREN